MKYIADVVEADVWERVATEMAGTHPWGTRSSTAAGVRFIRGFISDLSQFVDGREVRVQFELRLTRRTSQRLLLSVDFERGITEWVATQYPREQTALRNIGATSTLRDSLDP